eukprot:scpid51239/ scgid20306/ 
METNPFRSEEFICEFLPWITTLPADRFRNLAQKNHIIRTMESINSLSHIRMMNGSIAHNMKIIALASPGEHKAYLEVCEIIRQIGYPEKSDEMLKLLDSLKAQALEVAQGQGRLSPIESVSPESSVARKTTASGNPADTEKAAESPLPTATQFETRPPSQMSPTSPPAVSSVGLKTLASDIPAAHTATQPSAVIVSPPAIPAPVSAPGNVWHGPSPVESSSAVSPTSPALSAVPGYATSALAQAPPPGSWPVVSPTTFSPTTSPALPVVAGYATPTTHVVWPELPPPVSSAGSATIRPGVPAETRAAIQPTAAESPTRAATLTAASYPAWAHAAPGQSTIISPTLVSVTTAPALLRVAGYATPTVVTGFPPPSAVPPSVCSAGSGTLPPAPGAMAEHTAESPASWAESQTLTAMRTEHFTAPAQRTQARTSGTSLPAVPSLRACSGGQGLMPVPPPTIMAPTAPALPVVSGYATSAPPAQIPPPPSGLSPVVSPPCSSAGLPRSTSPALPVMPGYATATDVVPSVPSPATAPGHSDRPLGVDMWPSRFAVSLFQRIRHHRVQWTRDK